MPLLLNSSEPQQLGGKEVQQALHGGDTFQLLPELPERISWGVFTDACV